MTFYQETTSTSDSYQILHEEEAGAFGHVSVCQDVATGAVVAVKYLKKVSIKHLLVPIPCACVHILASSSLGQDARSLSRASDT